MATEFITVSEDTLRELEDEESGICVLCGEIAANVEPDAAGYECCNCGEMTVYGSEELVIRGLVSFGEDDD